MSAGGGGTNHKMVAMAYFHSHTDDPCALMAVEAKATFFFKSALPSLDKSPTWPCPLSRTTWQPPGKVSSGAIVPTDTIGGGSWSTPASSSFPTSLAA